MTDIEMVTRCAEKMIAAGEYREFHAPEDGDPWVKFSDGTGADYDPLHDDAQAMALVKKFRIQIDPHVYSWNVAIVGKVASLRENLNRAIVECVAKL